MQQQITPRHVLAKHFFRVIVAKMGSSNDIQTALEQWATQNFDSATKITNLKRLSGGASQETWSFDAEGAGKNVELILRRAPGGVPRARNSEAISLGSEALLLKSAADQNVPVPAVLGVSESGSDLGEAFIMDRIPGETIARRILRDSQYQAALGPMAIQCGEALAGIHRVPLDALPELPESGGLDQVAKYEGIYRAFDLPRPVFELSLAWLKSNAPTPLAPVLVHGDFRLGNLIVDEGGLRAVLDWELAHIGDPREDIGYICVNAWRFGHSEKRVGGFGQLQDLLTAYANAGGQQFTEAEVDWWEMLGTLKWGIMCMIMYEAYRSGADPSVERAAIGRRVSENEIDLLNLLSTKR